VDCWRNRPSDEVNTALAAFEGGSTTARSRAPRVKTSRRASSSSTGSRSVSATPSGQLNTAALLSAKTKQRAPPSVGVLPLEPPIEATDLSPSKEPRTTKSIATTAPPKDRRLKGSNTASQSSVSVATGRTTTTAAQPPIPAGKGKEPETADSSAQLAPPPPVSAAGPSRQFASSLDVDLAMVARPSRRASTEGKRVEMVWSGQHHNIRPNARWIVLGKGRALTQPLRGFRATAGGPLLGGPRAEDADAGTAAVSSSAAMPMQAGAGPETTAAPTLFRDAGACVVCCSATQSNSVWLGWEISALLYPVIESVSNRSRVVAAVS
jgi:hypothetical protein